MSETPDSPILLVEQRGVARHLILNRPEVSNAFNDELISDLIEALETAADDETARCVVLASNGKHFSAGADLNWMRRMAEYSQEENEADSRELARLMRTLNDLPKPTIARVQGAAFGGGVGLVACCDLAVASDRALFSLSEVRLGLIPAVISPFVVNAIGPRQARRYFLTAERFRADDAERLGLVHKIVKEEELDAAVDEWTQQLAGNGPQALAAAKELVTYVHQTPQDAGMDEELARRIASLRASEEGREGVSAFLEKRSANWTETN